MSSSESTAFRPQNLLGVLAYLWAYPLRTLAAVSMIGTVLALEMCLPRVNGMALNALSDAVAHGTPFSPIHYALLFLSIILVRDTLRFVTGRIRNRLVQRALKDLRASYYDAVQRLAFSYHDRTTTGELISRGTGDIFRLQDFMFACLYTSVDVFGAITVVLFMVTWISPVVSLAAWGTALPVMGLIVFYARKLHPQWRKVHDLHGELTTVIQETIAGVRVVKAFAQENAEAGKFCVKRSAFMDHLLETVRYWASRVPFAQFLFGLSLPLALALGGREVLAGRLKVGDLASILFYLMAIGHRMHAVGQWVNVVQNASASAERVMEVIAAPREIRGGTRKLGASFRGTVTFENVHFGYREGHAALHGLSFEVPAGRTVAVVGATGAGKSTLVQLIPRFYDPTQGQVKVDGIDVRELDLADLRRQVGVIFQETFLFSANVRENLTFGRPEATTEQMERAARAAQAAEFISQLERGYDTVVGERGVSLSGGQKQRLAIARALLLDPRILILDDATAAVDARTERLIREAMREVLKNRTAFVIAHRLSTVQHADEVLVLREGCLVERGTPAELIRSGTEFRRIFADQIGERA